MKNKSVFLNVEIKAKCRDLEKVRFKLINFSAIFKGIDHQTDTYFNVNNGRLKLREGNIENNLICYDRENKKGPKNSHFQLLKLTNPESLKKMLTDSLGIKMIVKKVREIYFIDNVKIHLDQLEELGTFIEIEASNLTKEISQEELLGQCNFYMKEFEVLEEDLLQNSYSDMMIAINVFIG